MTAIAYISPHNVPIIMADTMVSREDQEHNATVFPQGIGIAPNIGEANRLARKVYILSDATAVALAGEVGKIHDFLETANGLISKIEQLTRPMRRLGDLANDIGGIELIGAFANNLFTNVVSPRERQTMPVFGEYAVAGSGADELSRFLEHSSTYFTSPETRHYADQPYELARGTASSWGTWLMSDELVGLASKKTWGGIVEHVVFDRQQEKWVRGDSNISIFLLAVSVDFDTLTTYMMPQVVLYEPGDGVGSVCSANINTGDIVWWTLDDIVAPNQKHQSFSDVWTGWKPATATIRAEFPGAYLVPNSVGRSLNWTEMNEIDFECSAEKIRWGLSQRIQDKLSGDFCKIWGFNYLPSYRLNE